MYVTKREVREVQVEKVTDLIAFLQTLPRDTEVYNHFGEYASVRFHSDPAGRREVDDDYNFVEVL